MAGDWVKLYRSMMDSAVWPDEFLVKLWVWCIMKANYADKQWKDLTINRGQFVTGQHRGSEELGVSPSKWYRAMKQLEAFGNIAMKTNSHFTVVTICNYESYQCDDRDERIANELPMNSKRIADEQPANSQRIADEYNIRREEYKKGRIQETHTPAVASVRQKASVKDGEPEGFAQWYAAYPRHEARGAASKAYERAVKAFMVRDEMDRPTACKALLEVTLLFAESDAGKAGNFTPHPASWLNAARYFDDPTTWVRKDGLNGKRITVGAGQTYDPSAGKADPNFGKM